MKMKGKGEMRGLWHHQNPVLAKTGKLTEPSLAEGGGIGTDIAGTAMDLFLHHGDPFLAKKGVEMRRYRASEAMSNPELQKQAIHWAIKKGKPVLQKVGSEMLDQLSTKVRPNIRYKTDRPDLDGRGLPVPFPFVDFKNCGMLFPTRNFSKGLKFLPKRCAHRLQNTSGNTTNTKDKVAHEATARGSNGRATVPGSEIFSTLVSFPKVFWFATDPKLLKAFSKAVPNHHVYMDVLQKTLRNYYRKGVDVHALIGKLPAPKKGWTLPGHNYTSPYNPIDNNLEYDPEAGTIKKNYQPPSGPTDAIAMQHDVDYSICGFRAKKYGEDEKKCKHVSDRKMVKELDAIPRKQRQWGHALARNMINTKQKLGVGLPPGSK